MDENMLKGSPYVVGSKVPVRRLWAFYRNGASVDTLMKRYPKLGAGKIFDALAFAWDNPEVIEADLARESTLLGRDEKASVGSARGATQMELPFSR
jgi:uncharacterized protein (DUF433 family)